VSLSEVLDKYLPIWSLLTTT